MQTAKPFLQIRFAGLAIALTMRTNFTHPSNDARGAVAMGPKTSASGHKRHCRDAEVMSALPPKSGHQRAHSGCPLRVRGGHRPALGYSARHRHTRKPAFPNASVYFIKYFGSRKGKRCKTLVSINRSSASVVSFFRPRRCVAGGQFYDLSASFGSIAAMIAAWMFLSCAVTAVVSDSRRCRVS
jgi:hypothetical protein